MKYCYIILSDEFVSQHENHQNGANIFSYLKDNSGRNCASLNSVNDFPDIFSILDPSTLQLVWLERSDFPLPTNNENIN